jgi:1-acyl-sn-glycerol-3-phosphate acyltransferase
MWRMGVRIAPRVFRLYFPRTSIRGRDLTPRSGPLVVAANHFSHLDPVLVGMGVVRPVRYLAVDELYGNSRFFDRLILRLGSIPMSRTRTPLGALRTALRELEAGGAVGLFPEGVRVWNWGEERPRRGAAWLARRTGAPLLPVAVAGSDQAMGREARGIDRCPLAVTVCGPIHPADYDDREDPVGAMTGEWERRVGEALQEIYRSGGP